MNRGLPAARRSEEEEREEERAEQQKIINDDHEAERWAKWQKHAEPSRSRSRVTNHCAAIGALWTPSAYSATTSAFSLLLALLAPPPRPRASPASGSSASLPLSSTGVRRPSALLRGAYDVHSPE